MNAEHPGAHLSSLPQNPIRNTSLRLTNSYEGCVCPTAALTASPCTMNTPSHGVWMQLRFLETQQDSYILSVQMCTRVFIRYTCSSQTKTSWRSLPLIIKSTLILLCPLALAMPLFLYHYDVAPQECLAHLILHHCPYQHPSCRQQHDHQWLFMLVSVPIHPALEFCLCMTHLHSISCLLPPWQVYLLQSMGQICWPWHYPLW